MPPKRRGKQSSGRQETIETGSDKASTSKTPPSPASHIDHRPLTADGSGHTGAAAPLRRSARRKDFVQNASPEAGPSKKRRVEHGPNGDNGKSTPLEERGTTPTLHTTTSIDYNGFPHIFSEIFATLVGGYDEDREEVYRTLLSLRATSKDLRSRVDKVFFDHVLVSGKLPQGLSSRYGRIPSMCNDKSLGRKRSEYPAIVGEQSIRICDFAGVDSFNTSWYQQFKHDFLKVVGGMHHVKVFRHCDRFDLPYDAIPLSPNKVVRFLNVTKIWHSRVEEMDSVTLPESVKTLVINIKYTHDWNKWTEFFDLLTSQDVGKVVFIFDPVDGADVIPGDQPWRLQPFGIMAPIMQKLVWELQYRHILFDITFVGLPNISPLWTGLPFHGGESRSSDLMDWFRTRLKTPPAMVMDGTGFSDDEVETLFSRVKFLTRDEYVATLSPAEYIEEFCWFAPEEQDGESLL